MIHPMNSSFSLPAFSFAIMGKCARPINQLMLKISKKRFRQYLFFCYICSYKCFPAVLKSARQLKNKKSLNLQTLAFRQKWKNNKNSRTEKLYKEAVLIKLFKFCWKASPMLPCKIPVNFSKFFQDSYEQLFHTLTRNSCKPVGSFRSSM